MQQTFTDFKNDFYKRVPDLTLFDCGDINLLKVVLDGLKVNYVSKGTVRAYVFYPMFVFNLIRLYKKLRLGRSKNVFKSKEKTYLIFDSNRLVSYENSLFSIYFTRVIETIKRENCFLIKPSSSNVLDFDITDSEIECLYSGVLTEKQLILLLNLKSTLKNIISSNIFTSIEVSNIKFAFHKFFLEYCRFDNFLQTNNAFKKAIFTCHYHKEGVVYALKSNGIKCIELQHGLIAEQDIFYVLPESILKIKKELLFADYIGVFGNYWKNKLLKGYEYKEDRIFIIGNYQFEPILKNQDYLYLREIVKNKKTVVVTTQTYLHNEFINLVKALDKRLSKKYSDYLILIKPHPNEKRDLYENALKNLDNCIITELPIFTLFDFVKINITSYSTTLFDGLKFGVVNYVFRTEQTKDYVNAIINDRIANELNLDNVMLSTDKGIELEYESFYEKENIDYLKLI